MEPQYIREIPDVLRNEDTKTYIAVKTAILLRFRECVIEDLLLIPLQIVGRSPSEFLREIERLAGPNALQTLIRKVWAKRLTPQTQELLDVANELSSLPLSQLADIADIFASQPTSATCSSTSSPTLNTTLDSTLQDVESPTAETASEAPELIAQPSLKQSTPFILIPPQKRGIPARRTDHERLVTQIVRHTVLPSLRLENTASIIVVENPPHTEQGNTQSFNRYHSPEFQLVLSTSRTVLGSRPWKKSSMAADLDYRVPN
ncbi:Hypothetical protein NTJ_05608 [Nesidiocoris tenuis]|uniref:Uncharacterized protein n=1 Tax=Nesidiocoris tenuis TaxID=355587 RepID=A0ABN7AKQ8_9HEMI|nr:Hypothetical protein NTJ_05608 [Nesidiocoris tenuis]